MAISVAVNDALYAVLSLVLGFGAHKSTTLLGKTLGWSLAGLSLAAAILSTFEVLPLFVNSALRAWLTPFGLIVIMTAVIGLRAIIDRKQRNRSGLGLFILLCVFVVTGFVFWNAYSGATDNLLRGHSGDVTYWVVTDRLLVAELLLCILSAFGIVLIWIFDAKASRQGSALGAQ